MPLPLIAAVGAGILGGRRYLMNRQDQKSAQAQAGQLAQFVRDDEALASRPNLQYELMTNANKALSGGSMLGEPGRAGALEALQAQAQQYSRQVLEKTQGQNFTRRYQEEQLANKDRDYGLQAQRFGFDQHKFDIDNTFKMLDEYRAMEKQGWESQDQAMQVAADSRAIANEIQGDVGKLEQAFKAKEGQIRGAYEMLGDGSMSSMQQFAATFQFLQSLIPEAITEGDMSGALKAGGTAAELATALQRWGGKPGKLQERFRTETRDVLRRMNEENIKQYTPVQERAMQRMEKYRVDPLRVWTYSPDMWRPEPQQQQTSIQTNPQTGEQTAVGPQGQTLVIEQTPTWLGGK